MVYFARPNCQHLDNWRRCRIHTLPWWVRWLAPLGRPTCVLDQQRYMPAQDEEEGCPDQKPFPRPDPPKGWSAPPSKDD